MVSTTTASLKDYFTAARKECVIVDYQITKIINTTTNLEVAPDKWEQIIVIDDSNGVLRVADE